jgi:hypothetical protein
MSSYKDLLLDDWEVRYSAGNRLTLMNGGWMACVNKAADVMMIFDPAGVAVPVPEVYSMEELEASRWRCKACNRTADQLSTVALIGQLCVPCRKGQSAALD